MFLRSYIIKRINFYETIKAAGTTWDGKLKFLFEFEVCT